MLIATDQANAGTTASIGKSSHASQDRAVRIGGQGRHVMVIATRVGGRDRDLQECVRDRYHPRRR